MGAACSCCPCCSADKCKDPMNMQKGEFIVIPSDVRKFATGFGWKAGCDVDASVICLDEKGQCVARAYFKEKEALFGAVVHQGDNRTGQGAGDDETVDFDLDKVPTDVTHMFLTVNVYNKEKSFEDVKDEYVRVLGAKDKKEIVRIPHMDSYGKKNGIVLACIYRAKNGDRQWKFQAVGFGAMGRTSKDLIDECQGMQKSLK